MLRQGANGGIDPNLALNLFVGQKGIAIRRRHIQDGVERDQIKALAACHPVALR
jgi:hypothetical protein